MTHRQKRVERKRIGGSYSTNKWCSYVLIKEVKRLLHSDPDKARLISDLALRKLQPLDRLAPAWVRNRVRFLEGVSSS